MNTIFLKMTLKILNSNLTKNAHEKINVLI